MADHGHGGGRGDRMIQQTFYRSGGTLELAGFGVAWAVHGEEAMI